MIDLTQTSSTKLSEGQHIQHFRTSNNLIILRVLFDGDFAELKNAISLLFRGKHHIFK